MSTTNAIKYTYLSRPYSRTALQLGTLAHSTHDPISSYLLGSTPISSKDCSRCDDPQITVLGSSHISSKPKAHIAHVFLGDLDQSETRNLKIGAHHGFIYILREPKAWFRKLCGKNDVRKWLEESFAEGKETWLVLGFKTLVDADLVSNPSAAETKEKLAGNENGTKGAERGKGDVQQEWEFPGERIYAVRYAKVQLRFFESWECAPVRGPRWESHSKVLNGEGEVQIVEACIDDIEEELEAGR